MSRLLNLVTRMEEEGIEIIAVNEKTKVVFCKIANEYTPYVVWEYDESGDWFKGSYARDYQEGKVIFMDEAFYI